MVRARPFGYAGAPPQQLTLIVNGAEQPPAALPAELGNTLVDVEAGVGRAGMNRRTLSFGYAARPVDVGAGGDTRSLAAAVDFVRVEVISPADTAR